MLNKQSPFLYLSFALLLSCLTFMTSGSAGAVETPALSGPGSETTAATSSAAGEDPLTVRDILVDKTAENAVVARDQAIVEARRLALQKLAERNLSPEDFQLFQLPEDQDISLVVQDFEIKDEQLSSTRYVARFTVRFTADVKNYVDVGHAQPGPALSVPPVEAALPRNAAPRALLILPYFETVSGGTLLWEDANAWRSAWQSFPPAVEGWIVAVPLGDISDLAAGSSDAVWSGDYSVIEKLRTHYNVDEVVLPVANRSGATMLIDIYIYKDGKLSQKQSVMPYVFPGAPDEEAFKQGMAEVMRFLQNPDRQNPDRMPPAVIESISRSLTQGESGTIMIPPASAPEMTTSINASMVFDNFATWMELQKRLAALQPPVMVDIKSISRTGARFTMTFAGDMETLLRTLSGSGISLSEDAAETADGGKPAQDRLYDVQMGNERE